MKKYIGIDIGGTFIKYGVVDSKGDVYSLEKTATDRRNPRNVLDTVIEKTNELKKQYNLQGIGISLPGVISNENKMLTSGAIVGLENFNVPQEIETETGLSVTLTNDANSIAYAEKWRGAAKDCNNFACLSLGTGVGGSIMVNGQLVKGRAGAAGEFGMSLMQLGKTNPLGYESATFYGGAVAGLCRIYNQKLGKKDFNSWELNVKNIIKAAQNGDEIAIESLDEFYHNLSVILLNITVAIDPEIILIGGGISESETIMNGIKEAVYNLTNKYTDVTAIGFPDIINCKLGNTAGVIGSVFQMVN